MARLSSDYQAAREQPNTNTTNHRAPTVQASPETYDIDHIWRTIHLLEWGEDLCAELRALGNREIGHKHTTISGYYTEPELMTQTAARLSGIPEGVYCVLNPLPHRLLGRAANRIRMWAKHTTRDEEVLGLRWLLVDCDAVHPAGLSSTDEDHALAIERARAVRDHLHAEGLDVPVLADSGNGAHVLVRVDYPNDAEHCEVLQSVLRGLAVKFSDDRVRIDETTFNPARLCKLYGTMACKGDPIPGNPHRLSRLLEIDD